MKTIDRIIERINHKGYPFPEDDELVAYLERLKEPTDKMLSEGSIAICGKDQKMYRDDARITLKVMIEAAEEQE